MPRNRSGIKEVCLGEGRVCYGLEERQGWTIGHVDRQTERWKQSREDREGQMERGDRELGTAGHTWPQ